MIRIHGSIGEDVDAGDVLRQLAAWPTGRPLSVSIDSDGGKVYEALDIRKALDEHHPWTAIAPRAQSAALFIFASADRRLLLRNSAISCHPVRVNGMRTEETRQIERRLALILCCRSGGRLSFTAAVELMQDENRLTAEEALRLGIADDII